MMTDLVAVPIIPHTWSAGQGCFFEGVTRQISRTDLSVTEPAPNKDIFCLEQMGCTVRVSHCYILYRLPLVVFRRISQVIVLLISHSQTGFMFFSQNLGLYRICHVSERLGVVHKICYAIFDKSYPFPLPCHKLSQLLDILPLKYDTFELKINKSIT